MAYGLVRAIESELQKLKHTVDWNVKRATGHGVRLDEVGKELKGQYQTIGGLKKDILDLCEMLALRTKRIEALEKIHPFSLQDHRHTEKEPVPYDKDGNPEGGLKRGDVISYISCIPRNDNTKILGQFLRAEEDNIYGYWQHRGTSDLQGNEGFMPKSQVTFEFRPKLPGNQQ